MTVLMKVDLSKFEGKTLVFTQEEHRSGLSTEQFVKENLPDLKYAWLKLDQHIEVYAPACVSTEVVEHIYDLVFTEGEYPQFPDFIALPLEGNTLSTLCEDINYAFLQLEGPESEYLHRWWFDETLSDIIKDEEGMESYWATARSYPEMILKMPSSLSSPELVSAVGKFFEARIRKAGYSSEQVELEFIYTAPPCKSEIRFVFDDARFFTHGDIARFINAMAGRTVSEIE